MKAFILCAGLGTRLRPWTLTHPKALVPVGGVPMLKRVIDSLTSQGFDSLTLNVHHFASQIIDFLAQEYPACDFSVSDESDKLLETGGALLHAAPYLAKDSAPFLVHNVDILSNADLKALYDSHMASGADVTLLVSDRDSSRKLVFGGSDMRLKGWVNTKTQETRPEGFVVSPDDVVLAFSGIYVVSPRTLDLMREAGFRDAFPVMDFLLKPGTGAVISGFVQDGLDIIDIGKPETLRKANLEVSGIC